MITFDSEICKDGKYCDNCREYEIGRPWRIEMIKKYIITPPGGVNFVCFYRNPWKNFTPAELTINNQPYHQLPIFKIDSNYNPKTDFYSAGDCCGRPRLTD